MQKLWRGYRVRRVPLAGYLRWLRERLPIGCIIDQIIVNAIDYYYISYVYLFTYYAFLSIFWIFDLTNLLFN